MAYLIRQTYCIFRGGDKSHTVYSLHLPSAASLYKEMVRVGRSHRSASPSTYLHLLLEAHLVLTTALQHEMPTEDEAEEDLYSLLQDSSALLGDYYAQWVVLLHILICAVFFPFLYLFIIVFFHQVFVFIFTLQDPFVSVY